MENGTAVSPRTVVALDKRVVTRRIPRLPTAAETIGGDRPGYVVDVGGSEARRAQSHYRVGATTRTRRRCVEIATTPRTAPCRSVSA